MSDLSRSVRMGARSILVPMLMILSGCSSADHSGSRNTSVVATEHIEAPIRRLEARSELETLTPTAVTDPAVLAVFIPEGFRPLKPGTPEHQLAMQPLDRVLAELGGLPAPIETDPPSFEHVQQAKKLYVAARSKLLDGDTDGAVSDLTRASNLDPSSPGLFGALGDAYLDLGDRLSAMDAYRQGVELGDRSPRALAMLASEAVGARDPETALRYASAARAGDPSEPMARSVASALIGGILIDDGHLLAGATALTEAIESFDAGSRDPRWRAEIIQFHTQQPLLWMRVGDAWSALGATARAQNAYERASEPDQPPPFGLVARRIGSSLLAGRPASGALTLIDHLSHNASSTAEEERQWAAALRSLDALGPIVPEAIAELRNTTAQTESSARALLRIELSAQTNAERVEALAIAPGVLVTSVVAAEAIAGITDETARYQACVQISGVNPAVAQPLAAALVRSLQQPFSFAASRSDRSDPRERLLIAWMCIELGRADLLDEWSALPADSEIELLNARAQLLALNGDYRGADALIEQLAASESPDSIRARARTLLIAQHPERAWALITENANYSDAGVTDLEAAGMMAITLNKPEDARSFFERAIETDPGFEEGYEQLIVLHAPGGALEDAEEHRRIIRQLSSVLPRSMLMNLVRVNELARNGALRDAENFLVALAARSPHRDVGIQLLGGIWGALAKTGDAEAEARAERWLRSDLDRTPSSIPVRRTLAGFYIAKERFDDALALLDDGYERTGSFELARAAEQLLAASMDRPDDAIERALVRTKDLHGADALFERAARLAQSGQNDRAYSILRDEIDPGIEFLPSQREQFLRALYLLAGTPDVRASSEWIGIVDRESSRLAPLPMQIRRLRAVMLADLDPTNTDVLIAATQDAVNALDADADPSERSALELLCVQRLLSNDRKQDAFSLLHAIAVRSGSLDEQLGIEIVRLCAGLGDRVDATRVVERFARDGYLPDIVRLSHERLGLPDREPPAASDDQFRSETAYIIASVAQAFGRDEPSMDFFELALSYDDSNPWTNNDYGYMLVERNERLDEAEAMLVRAASALPGSASILDSLGWARYKLGVLETRGEREGAASILQRAKIAAGEEESGENATIHEHLGDTLWRLRRFDDAMSSWIDAERVLRDRLQDAAGLENPNERAIDRVSAQLRDLRLKISDAESGRAPAVAPIPGFTEPVPTREEMPGMDPGK
ncbi:MAG: hypothetical protein KC996_02190 [Phycisphaerales bacterium]|nr:hypothetical protein [Phycisphaerales bacterium]